ncbi:TorD/DmsD family molecular chaperone [Desulfococcus sp.]|uniref:TorD/DmsD family molecular chaperone n=1 Tax=Desulfococcus sp. TaxID=2025834 RepID=UPI003D0D83E0
MDLKEELIARERAKAMIYRRLADAFQLPEKGLSTILRQLASALSSLGSTARHDAEALFETYRATKDIQALQVEYTRLFAGPFLAAAPPYGSIYLEKKRVLMGPSTQDVQRHYRSVGVDVSPAFKDAPDHVCAELEFMYVLIRNGIHAVETGDDAMLLEAVQHLRKFLTGHIGAWLPVFADKVIAHARTDFYRRLASAARTFIIEEIAALPRVRIQPPQQ